MTNERELVIRIKLDKEATETATDVRDVLANLGNFLAASSRFRPVDLGHTHPGDLRDSTGEYIGSYTVNETTYYGPKEVRK